MFYFFYLFSSESFPTCLSNALIDSSAINDLLFIVCSLLKLFFYYISTLYFSYIFFYFCFMFMPSPISLHMFIRLILLCWSLSYNTLAQMGSIIHWDVFLLKKLCSSYVLIFWLVSLSFPWEVLATLRGMCIKTRDPSKSLLTSTGNA